MSDKEIRRLELESKIIEIYNEFDCIYGAPKIRKEPIKQKIVLESLRQAVYNLKKQKLLLFNQI